MSTRPRSSQIDQKGESDMGREKDRKLRRKKRRRAKLRKYKARLAQTKDLKERERLVEKIRKISFYPMTDLSRE
jgi:hypothetical protein